MARFWSVYEQDPHREEFYQKWCESIRPYTEEQLRLSREGYRPEPKPGMIKINVDGTAEVVK